MEMETMEGKTKLDFALEHVRQSRAVFPLYGTDLDGNCDCRKPDCKNQGKHPATSNGFKDASKDEEQIRRWWAKHPNANIGIATGAVSGFIALDVDVKNGAKGRESLRSLKGIPPTLTVNTPTGGWHHYLFLTSGQAIGSRAPISREYPGLDIRGDGGYVVGAGSAIGHKVYEWVNHETPIAPIPQCILEIAARNRKPTAGQLNGQAEPGASANGVIKLLRPFWKSGQRDAISLALGGYLAKLGIPKEQTIEIVHTLADDTGDDEPLKRIESIRRSYEKVHRGEAVQGFSGLAEVLPSDVIQKIASLLPSGDGAQYFEGRTFRPAVLADAVREESAFISFPIDAAGQGVGLWRYEEGVYRPNGEDYVRKIADQKLGVRSTEERLSAVVAMVRERSKAREEELNPKALALINCRNGMLDWAAGKLLPHSPDFRSTFQINADYAPDVRCTAVNSFLRDVFPNDSLVLVEEILGYLLLPSTKHQRAFLLLGEGENGKSTFFSMLETFLGHINVSHVPLQDLVENRFVVPMLQGKLVNIYADIPQTALEQSSIFKAIVSGDPIKAEKKFSAPFDFKPTARLFFSANELPRSRDLTQAYFRRWAIIPFPNKFQGTKARKDLITVLTTPEARSALLNLALAGLGRLEAQQRFSDCPSVVAAGQRYRRDCDSAFEFIQEKLDAKPTSTLPKDDIYKHYCKWAEAEGISYPVSRQVFNARIEAVLGVKEVRERNHRVWLGVGFKNVVPAQEVVSLADLLKQEN